MPPISRPSQQVHEHCNHQAHHATKTRNIRPVEKQCALHGQDGTCEPAGEYHVPGIIHVAERWIDPVDTAIEQKIDLLQTPRKKKKPYGQYVLFLESIVRTYNRRETDCPCPTTLERACRSFTINYEVYVSGLLLKRWNPFAVGWYGSQRINGDMV